MSSPQIRLHLDFVMGLMLEAEQISNGELLGLNKIRNQFKRISEVEISPKI